MYLKLNTVENVSVLVPVTFPVPINGPGYIPGLGYNPGMVKLAILVQIFSVPVRLAGKGNTDSNGVKAAGN